jgi:hypothetical protein
MTKKKLFKTYYLLVCEGQTEFNLFAYLKNKFREFQQSDIRFSNKIEIKKLNISGGILHGVNNTKQFITKNKLIKKHYHDQNILYILDQDLKDTQAIVKIIKKQTGDVVQFIKYNSEYFLLNLKGVNLSKPAAFTADWGRFRRYCKERFFVVFGKKAHELKDADFDKIFRRVNYKTLQRKLPALTKLIATKL